MYCFGVRTYAPIASFRIPETHIFQQSLPLPPITTLIGILGAAVGLSFEEAMNFYEENEIQFGIIGTNKGRFRDLWKYRKVKSDENITAVLIREYLIDLEMTIYVAALKENLIKTIRQHFLNPCFALTVGNSDSLLKIVEASEVRKIEIVNLDTFSNTVLPGDQAKFYESNIDVKTVPLMKEIYAPQVHLLPTQFDFLGSERRVKKREPFTFVDIPVKLKRSVLGFEINGKAVPLL